MSTAIFWFRQDLRCDANPALALACESHQRLLPLYIKDTTSSLKMGGAQHWWLHHSLEALQKDLSTVGLDLCLRDGNPLTLLKQLIKQYQIEAVYWNRCYEPMHITRDQHIKTELKAMGIQVISCNGSLLHEPWEILNQSKNYFKVFTPYWRQCLKQMHVSLPKPIKDWPQSVSTPSNCLGDWNLLPTHPNWAIEFKDYWQPGETGARLKLEEFIDQHLHGYKEKRNKPGKIGTSRLSPHLHFGEISPHQVWEAVQQAMQDPRCDLVSAETFLSELGWREFSYHLLYHYPELMNRNFKPQFDHFPWHDDDSALSLWQQGLTGYPIVDAGMRELWRTGYMHNRVRMIAASFLIKDLMIDWRKGAAWFWDTLLDADLANNSASWQWVAGSGADAAPYFRIFNPVVQGEKFDPLGDYTKFWVPELAGVPMKWIHKPWTAPKGTLNIELGTDYPLPIVDHAVARDIALSSYKGLSVPRE